MPSGAGTATSSTGSLLAGSTDTGALPCGWLTVTSASQFSSRVPRSALARALSSCGCWSMKLVVSRPATKSGSLSSASRNAMLVETPRIRNSASARLARCTAFSKDEPRHVSLASIESKCAEISAPVYVVPPSRRTPAPPGERYVVILPVSGRKPLAGSSVVIRHWSAAPRRDTESWESPRSARVSPDAIRICDCTRSTSVTSSVTVCSTWIRGFISMNT